MFFSGTLSYRNRKYVFNAFEEQWALAKNIDHFWKQVGNGKW